METYQIDINFEQIINIVKQCTPAQQQQLLTELLQANPRLEFALFMQKFNKASLTDNSIREEVETVRQQQYEQKQVIR